MSIPTNVINNFISEQVKSGNCSSFSEAEKEIKDRFFEKELDERIKKGREDVRVGKVRVSNKENNTNFLNELKKSVSKK